MRQHKVHHALHLDIRHCISVGAVMPFRGLTKDKNKKNCSTKTVPEMMLSGPDSPDETALEYEKLSQKKH